MCGAMTRYSEIKKLDKMLDNAGIKHDIRAYHDGFALGYPSLAPGKINITVVQHGWSHGGNYNLLEAHGRPETDGMYLTEQQVYEAMLKVEGEKTDESSKD